MKLICCTVMVVLSSVFAFSGSPQSGALLEIDGTVTSGTSSAPVHLKVYDSQIHTGVVAVPALPPTASPASNCTSADEIPTDAYLLQAGAPTGCDQGDSAEANLTTLGSSKFVSPTGSTVAYEFDISTQYVCAPATGGPGSACGAAPVTSTNGTTSNDSGFLTVTNNATPGSTFTGTIKLSGTPQGTLCGTTRLTDTVSSGLAPGASAVLALSADSSSCGGFNQAQTLTISNTATSIAKFGKDDFQITPSTASTGDTLDVLPIPVPAGPTGTETSPAASSLVFSPGTTFPNLKCIPYADFSAPNNPVCVELQLTPGGTDNGNYIYTSQNDFNIDANSLAGGIGGPSYLGQHQTGCPANGFNINIFLSYTAPSATFGDPLKGSGGGTGSCWVTAFDPNAGAVPVGATVGFVGFQSPVVDTKINVVKAGSSVPLKWQQFAGDGTAETNLSWCVTLNTDGITCAAGPPPGNPPAPPPNAPWVFLGTFPIACPNDALNTATDTTSSLASGKSGFQANFPSAGFYQFNWQTDPKSTGCVALVLQYDTGIQVLQAIFKYSKT